MSFLTLGMLVSCGCVTTKAPEVWIASDPVVARSYARKMRRPLLVAYAPSEGGVDRLRALFAERSIRNRLGGFVPVLIDSQFNLNLAMTPKETPPVVAMYTIDATGRIISRIGGGLTIATVGSYLDRSRIAIATGLNYETIGSSTIRSCAKSDEIRCRGQFDAAVKLLETAWKSAADSGDRFESGVRYISCLMSKNDRAKAIAIINDIAKSPDLDRDQLTAVANYQKRLDPPRLQGARVTG